MEKEGQREDETVPCMFCGTPTLMTATKKCDWCWEVTRRINDFLLDEKGRDFVRESLAKADARFKEVATSREGGFDIIFAVPEE